MGQLRSFDYGYQAYTPIPAEAASLLPGDELALTCTYDSSARPAATRFGRGTMDEMCVHWITYFPAQEELGCARCCGASTAWRGRAVLRGALQCWQQQQCWRLTRAGPAGSPRCLPLLPPLPPHTAVCISVCVSVGSTPFGICAPAPPESLQVALAGIKALPPVPAGGLKTLRQLATWIQSAVTPPGADDQPAGTAARLRQSRAQHDSGAAAPGADGSSGGGGGADQPPSGKAPLAEAASGVGLLLKLLGNGTLYVTGDPARTAAPYRPACNAQRP